MLLQGQTPVRGRVKWSCDDELTLGDCGKYLYWKDLKAPAPAVHSNNNNAQKAAYKLDSYFSPASNKQKGKGSTDQDQKDCRCTTVKKTKLARSREEPASPSSSRKEPKNRAALKSSDYVYGTPKKKTVCGSRGSPKPNYLIIKNESIGCLSRERSRHRNKY